LRRFGSARWRKRNLTFDKITFFLVFLIIPVAFYIAFVVSPFVQAAYFSLTDWTGFTPTMQFRQILRRGFPKYGRVESCCFMIPGSRLPRCCPASSSS